LAISRPSGTVTFLFTDIEGSTKIAQEHRAAWEGLRRRHHAILEQAMEKNGGHVFQIIGDAFCVAFPTAGEALNAAVEAQRRLQAEPWGQVRLRVRMGIHTGTAQAGGDVDRSGGYSGYSAMARAQRVMSTAYGEQILVSTTTADLLQGELPNGVALLDMNEHRLKGLLNPEHLWQVLAADLVQEFPALQSLNSIPNNLPLQLTSFIGREKELAEIKTLVDHNRLVTLTGSGGVGKTRHALQVSAEVLDAFPDGAWLVELASVSDAALVVPTVAAALGVREVQGRPLVAALEDHLRNKSLLLLLDDCEHMLGACAQLVDDLLHACRHLKILVSSREALAIDGEVAFRVTSLSLPDPHHLPALETLSQYDSVRLFIERAIAVKSDFVISNDNAPAVAQVCSRLDGIPLAIELAAARVKGLSVEQIAQRLDDRFRLLTGGSRTALPRHRTLRAMIEWSYDLLSEPERALLRQLAVFIGDWTLEAAEAVSAPQPGAGAATTDVLDLLLRLVDKSLITPQEQAGQTRYRMLETIREFAVERLSESGEEQRLRERHLEFFLHFSEEAAPRLRGAQQWIWLRQLGDEYENLRAALEWARESHNNQPVSRLAQATEQLADFQLLLGAGTQALPLYQAALEMRQGAEVAEPVIVARLHGKIIQTLARLFRHVDRAKFETLRQDAEVPRAALMAALDAMPAGPPDPERFRLLSSLAYDALFVRQPRDWSLAEQHARDALAIAEVLDSPIDLSMALGTLSDVLAVRGTWRERAQVTLRRMALNDAAQLGDVQERVIALIDAGEALEQVGEYTEAIRLLLEGETLAAQVHLVDLEKWGLDQRIHCLLGLDRWDEVLTLDVKLRDMQRRYPRERIGPSCYAISAIARIHGLRGEQELARAQRNEADAIMTDIIGPHENWLQFQHY
jgi:predicted ATPase/class 3 adenylate cyclase